MFLMRGMLAFFALSRGFTEISCCAQIGLEVDWNLFNRITRCLNSKSYDITFISEPNRVLGSLYLVGGTPQSRTIWALARNNTRSIPLYICGFFLCRQLERALTLNWIPKWPQVQRGRRVVSPLRTPLFRSMRLTWAHFHTFIFWFCNLFKVQYGD